MTSSFKIWLTLLLLAGLTSAARADAGSRMPAQVPAPYQQECAACHVAYPPGLLPAASWQALMRSLDKHYGSDASLDEPTVRQIAKWLQTHAGKGVREIPLDHRITRSAWFVRKHRRIDAAVWTHPSVKSAAHCAACHVGADKGRFEDGRGLILPAGLDARHRLAWNR